MIARRLLRLEDAYAERVRRGRRSAEYLAECERAEAERAANAPMLRQMGRLLDTDPVAHPMLSRALYLCENGGPSPADRPEAERLAAVLNEKLLAAHLASGDEGTALTLNVGRGGAS